MKKIFLIAALVAPALFTACNDNKGAIVIENEADTLAYELGMVNSPAKFLPEYLVKLGSDSACVEEYLKGVKEGIEITDPKVLAYELGKQHGLNLRNAAAGVSQDAFGEGVKDSLNVDLVLAGFIDLINDSVQIKNNSIELTQEMAYYDIQKRIQSIKMKRAALEHAPNKKAGEDFLAAKAKEEGVKALAKGVLYKEIKAGNKNGKKPTLSDRIKVTYKGTTIDGAEFDGNEEIEFPLGAMVEGWKIALPEMTEGSKWEIYIPQELAYGERGAMPDIKPYSALVFEVELHSVVVPEAKKK